MILSRIVSYAGTSINGESVPCEYHKRSIINTILKGIDESIFQTANTASDENGKQNNTEIEYLEQMSSPFIAWLNDIVKSADETIACGDNGDRDNVMYNPIFANDFIRLCKILPLWSGISCDLFEIDEITSSSSNVESDFKNLKQSLADIIPCSVDIFVEEHIEMLRGATIEASQQHNYVKFIEINETENSNDEEYGNSESDTSYDTEDDNYETEKSNDGENEYNESEKSNDEEYDNNGTEKSNDEEFDNNETDISNEKGRQTKQTPIMAVLENVLPDKIQSPSITPISACRNGGEPGGAHRCVECKKAVHILPCCSISIGDEEGYGEKRLCNECASAQKTPTPIPSSVSQVVSEMEYNESWNKSKKKTSSKYMKPAPNWNLNMNINKKVKVGVLQNGNLFNTTYKVDKQKIALTNTCTFDSICQVKTVKYIYYFRSVNIRTFLGVSWSICILFELPGVYGQDKKPIIRNCDFSWQKVSNQKVSYYFYQKFQAEVIAMYLCNNIIK